MSRINAPTPGEYDTEGIEKLPDLDPILMKLGEVTVTDNSKFAKGEKDKFRLMLRWETIDNVWVFDFVSFRLGENRGGQASKLRVLLNALHNRPANTPVAWIDDQTLEYGLDGDAVSGNLAAGVKIVVRGTKGSRTGRDGVVQPTFNVTTYQPYVPQGAAAAVAQAFPAATAPVAAPAAPVAAPAAPVAAPAAPVADPAAPVVQSTLTDF